MMHCQFNSPGEGVYSSRIPNEFTFPDWLEVDEEWFGREVRKLALEFPVGVYYVNAVYSIYVRPARDFDGFMNPKVVREVYSVDLHRVGSLYHGHGVKVGTVVGQGKARDHLGRLVEELPVPVESLSHGTDKEEDRC